MEGNQQLQVASVVTLILLVKSIFSNLVLGWAKYVVGARAPEDTYQKNISSDDNEQDEESVSARDFLGRSQRIVNNDLENIPIGLIVVWASALCQVEEKMHLVLCGLFAAMRVFHTISYMQVRCAYFVPRRGAVAQTPPLIAAVVF